jgi:hypothetical protein
MITGFGNSPYARHACFKSIDYGATFHVTSYLNTGDVAASRFANVCCSDDGKYLYFYVVRTGLAWSSDYGYTWTYRTPVSTHFEGNGIFYVSCDSTGRFLQAAGAQTGGLASAGYMFWSNNFIFNNTLDGTTQSAPRNVFVPAGNLTGAKGSAMDKHTATLFINGNDLSGNTVLYYKEPTGNRFPTTRGWTDISNGYVKAFNSTGRYYNGQTVMERDVFFSITAQSMAYAGTSGITGSISQTGTGLINFTGFPCVVSKSNFLLAHKNTPFAGDLSKCFYSMNNGSTWNRITGGNTIIRADGQDYIGATTVLDGNKIYLYSVIASSVETEYIFRTVSFTVG